MNLKSSLLLFVLLFTTGALSDRLAGQDQDITFDRIWQFAEWYSNDDNPVIQSMALSGRVQYEYGQVEAGGTAYDEWNLRRTRFGAEWGLFHQFTLHLEAGFNPQERDPLYKRLTDFNLEWSRSRSLAITVGKQGVPFTIDGSTSSKELLTIDRSNLANNMWFPQEYMPGIAVSGEQGSWVYQTGIYSAGEQNREFGNFSAGAFTLVSIGYDLAESLGVDEALLRGNYIYQDPNLGNTFTRQLEHVASLNLKLEAGSWGLRTDLSNGQGYLGRADVWGTTIMPYVSVTPKLQLLTRLTHIASENSNGVRLARYEKSLSSGWGDRYQELYIGTNYFFYGHALKLQSGVKFADMDDSALDGGAYSGTSWTTGLRVSW